MSGISKNNSFRRELANEFIRLSHRAPSKTKPSIFAPSRGASLRHFKQQQKYKLAVILLYEIVANLNHILKMLQNIRIIISMLARHIDRQTHSIQWPFIFAGGHLHDGC